MQSLRARLPPLNALVAFEAAARLLSFTRAGQELGVSREAVSRQIRALEEDLGARLFERRNRAVYLTEAGRELGRVDIRKLRPLVGFTSAGFADLLRPQLTATDIVMTAKYGALEPWWHTYDDLDREGLVQSRRGKGFWVAPIPNGRKNTMAEERFVNSLKKLVAHAAAEGLSKADMRRILDSLLKKGPRK